MMDTGQRVKLVKSRAWQIRRRQEKHITERLSFCVCCALLLPYLCDGTFPRPVAGCGAGLKRRNDAAGKRRQLCVGWRYLLYCGGGRYRVLHTIEKEKQ